MTGASGILGSYVVAELLRQGEKVVACRQSQSSLDAIQNLIALQFGDGSSLWNEIEWRELDITSLLSIEQCLQGIDRVYHCAGLVSFSPSSRSQLYRLNEEGTANLVNVCLSRPGIQLCHVSSIGTLNNTEHRGPLNESVFWKNTGREGHYARSKYNAEREVWRGMEEGLSAVIVNPGVILAAPFWKQSSLELLRTAYRGNRFYTSGKTAVVMAEDVAAVMVKLMTQQQFGKRYVVIENNYTFYSLFSALRKGFGYKGRLIGLPKNLLTFVSFVERFFSFFIGRDPFLNPSFMQSAFNQQEYSRAELDKTLAQQFLPVPDSIPKLCEIYLKLQCSGPAKTSGSAA